MKTPRFFPLMLPVLCLSLAGCESFTFYHSYRPVPKDGWKRGDTLTYTLPASKAGKHTFTAMEVGIRHTARYPYRDIWLELRKPYAPDSHPDTLHIVLTDSKGEWKGAGSEAGTFQHAEQAKCTLSPAAGDSVLQIVHIMGDSLLQGITDVGIRLTFTGSVDAQKDEQQDGKSPQ